MVGPLGVAFQVFRVEVDGAEVSGGVAGGFVIKMGRIGMAAFASGGDGAGANLGAEFDDSDEGCCRQFRNAFWFRDRLWRRRRRAIPRTNR